MKNSKNKLKISTTIFLIFFIVTITNPQHMSNNKALVNENTKTSLDSCEEIPWKWGETEVVSTESTASSYWPSIAVDSVGNIHIAWEDPTNYTNCGTDTDIFYKRWNTSTSTWSITEVVSTESTDSSSWPSLAIDASDNIHIAWGDPTNYTNCGTDTDIFYNRWNTSTSTWSITEVVSTESTDTSFTPSLAVDASGNVHIVWYDRTNYTNCGTDRDIFYKYWDTSTESWTTTEVVSTESTGSSYYPSLAVDASETVHITWRDTTDYAYSGAEADIFYKRKDTSFSWTTTEVVSTISTDTAFIPKIAIDSAENIHIAWYDLSNILLSGTDMDIFYKRWDASLFSWSTTELVSNISTESSSDLAIATDSIGNVHIVWGDSTNYTNCGTDTDIFYRKLTSPLTAPELSPILPNPTYTATIFLDWNDVPCASLYYIYRSTSNILSVEGLTPVGSTVTSFYDDTLSTSGTFYYVIVANNFNGNSTPSNCWSIVYIPAVPEFSRISGLMLATFTFLMAIVVIRKKKLKRTSSS